MSSETGPRPRRADPFHSAAEPRGTQNLIWAPASRLTFRNQSPSCGSWTGRHCRHSRGGGRGGRPGSFCKETPSAGPAAHAGSREAEPGETEAGKPPAGAAPRPAGGRGRDGPRRPARDPHGGGGPQPPSALLSPGVRAPEGQSARCDLERQSPETRPFPGKDISATRAKTKFIPQHSECALCPHEGFTDVRVLFSF